MNPKFSYEEMWEWPDWRVSEVLKRVAALKHFYWITVCCNTSYVLPLRHFQNVVEIPT